MRASFLTLGPLLAEKFRKKNLSLWLLLVLDPLTIHMHETRANIDFLMVM